MSSIEILAYVVFGINMSWEKFEDTKGVIKVGNSKKVQTTQWPKEKGQTSIYKTIHIKLNIGLHEPPQFQTMS
jgi:hypothetical protein